MQQPPAADHFLGVALSGGGSRAAIFAAAGLAELEELGLLQHITHVSSVSGGGLPAGYMAANRSSSCTPSGNASCLAAPFEQMVQQISRDFTNEMLKRQYTRPNRWMHSSERVSSLEEAFSAHITNGQTLADLPDIPVFLFTSVSYDTAQSYVMSNVPLPHPKAAHPTLLPQTLRSVSFSSETCTRSLPRDTSLALAMASSAAFPPVYGPVTIAQPSEFGTEFTHLGDGGISENTGVDVLLEAGLDAAARNPEINRLTLIAFDAGLKINDFRSRATHDLRLWSSAELTRLVDVPNLRGDRYRDVVEAEILADSPIPIEIVRLPYGQAQIEWHASCPKDVQNQFETTGAYLESIPTGFSIDACATQMLRLAAKSLVTQATQPGEPLAELPRLMAAEQ